LLEFCTGKQPFEGTYPDMSIALKISQGISPLDYCLEKFTNDCDLIECNPDLEKLLRACFQKNYTNRPSSAMVYEDEFFIGYTY
jgi:serine/threonine protein kinase